MKTIFLFILMIMSLLINAQSVPGNSDTKTNKIRYFVGAGGDFISSNFTDNLSPNLFGGIRYKRHRLQVAYTFSKEAANESVEHLVGDSTDITVRIIEPLESKTWRLNYSYQFEFNKKWALETGLAINYIEQKMPSKYFNESGDFLKNDSFNTTAYIPSITNRLTFQAWKNIDLGFQLNIYLTDEIYFLPLLIIDAGINLRYEF